MIDINKVGISHKLSCNNGKDCHYILGYQANDTLIPLLIKTPKDVFNYGVSQYDKNSTYTMISEEKAWKTQYKKDLE